MVRGDLGSNPKLDGLVGWLVVFYTSSFPFDRECYYDQKTPPARTFNKRAISASQEGLLYPRQTKQNKILKKIRYGAMHKVMIGFVFPIGK